MTKPNGQRPKGLRQATILASSAVAEDDAHGSVAPPIGLSTTFRWDDHRERPTYDYARTNNPNREQLLRTLCDLEGAEGGTITATGMAALDLCLSLVNPGDLVLAPHDCYGGTHRLLTVKAKRGLYNILFADLSDAAVRAEAFAQKPKLAYIETPSNPLMRITDLADCTRLAQAAGTLTVADNTFLSPMLQNPLEWGCDMVVHSTTKYIAGHSDVVGGAVLAAKRELGDELAWWANCTGVVGPAFDSWLTLRGLRSLEVRMARQQETAGFIAEELSRHPDVARVHYPGLADHPGHAVAARQQKGFGSMVSFDLREGLDLKGFFAGLSIANLAESLGGFETLICVPDTMTHAGMAEEARREAGVGPGLLRLSVGLEHVDDLWADLQDGLRAADIR